MGEGWGMGDGRAFGDGRGMGWEMRERDWRVMRDWRKLGEGWEREEERDGGQ